MVCVLGDVFFLTSYYSHHYLNVFSHLHVRMLESDKQPLAEGSGTMLFRTLKSLLMLLPQSTCYDILQNRLVSTSRFRQSVLAGKVQDDGSSHSDLTQIFVSRVVEVRDLHCRAMWETVRIDSLETPYKAKISETKEDARSSPIREEGQDRREWLGFASKEEHDQAQARYQDEKKKQQQSGLSIEEIKEGYNTFESMPNRGEQSVLQEESNKETDDDNGDDGETWKGFWEQPKENPAN